MNLIDQVHRFFFLTIAGFKENVKNKFADTNDTNIIDKYNSINEPSYDKENQSYQQKLYNNFMKYMESTFYRHLSLIQLN
jgi:hypothetical protein